MNVLVITQKLRAQKGNIVCLTKIEGTDNNKIKPGDQFVGKLENEVTVGSYVRIAPINGSCGIRTTEIASMVVSFNAILVRTNNSTYLLERID